MITAMYRKYYFLPLLNWFDFETKTNEQKTNKYKYIRKHQCGYLLTLVLLSACHFCMYINEMANHLESQSFDCFVLNRS